MSGSRSGSGLCLYTHWFAQVSLKMITTDASLMRWGGVLDTLSVQGTWSLTESCLSNNILELCLMYLSLQPWTPWLEGQLYINYLGGLEVLQQQRR